MYITCSVSVNHMFVLHVLLPCFSRVVHMFLLIVHVMFTCLVFCRMNEMIMKWSSQQLYDGKLLADVSVAQHLLRHLPEVNDTELTSLPLLMIDTAGCDLYELQAQDEESKGNEGEADVVAAHIEGLVESGVKQRDIGVITPYNLQVKIEYSYRKNLNQTLFILDIFISSKLFFLEIQ